MSLFLNTSKIFLNNLVVRYRHYIFGALNLGKMHNSKQTIDEIIRQAHEGIKQAKAHLRFYEGIIELSKIEIVSIAEPSKPKQSKNNLQLVGDPLTRVTFEFVVTEILKQADKPLTNKDIHSIYITKGKSSLTYKDFTSKISIRSKNANSDLIQVHKAIKGTNIVLWGLKEWCEDGVLKPEYQKKLEEKLKEIQR